MPVVINEIVIKTNIEVPKSGNSENALQPSNAVEEIVQQAVKKVMEILEEKKQR